MIIIKKEELISEGAGGVGFEGQELSFKKEVISICTNNQVIV